MVVASSTTVFSRTMSSAEIEFCRQIRDLLHASQGGRAPFFAVVSHLLTDLRRIRTDDVLDATGATGFVPSIVAVPSIDWKQARQAEMSALELAFISDLDGFMDFALRNGLTFFTVLSVLLHDLTEIAANEFQLQKATAQGFRPKVDGWAKRNAEPVGESDEVLD